MIRALIRLWFRLKGIWACIKTVWRSPWWHKCGRECAWVPPYGFVPEADCPVHDPPPVDCSETGQADGLLPCPFCGGDRVKVATVEWIGRSVVVCMNGRCCCEGPTAEYGHQARRLWNGRHVDADLVKNAMKRFRANCL